MYSITLIEPITYYAILQAILMLSNFNSVLNSDLLLCEKTCVK